MLYLTISLTKVFRKFECMPLVTELEYLLIQLWGFVLSLKSVLIEINVPISNKGLCIGKLASPDGVKWFMLSLTINCGFSFQLLPISEFDISAKKKIFKFKLYAVILNHFHLSGIVCKHTYNDLIKHKCLIIFNYNQ